MSVLPARLVVLALLLVASPLLSAQALPDFTRLVEENAPAIVNISTTKVLSPEEAREQQSFEELLRYFYGDEHPALPIPEQPPGGQRASMGSGFVISDDGYLVTNHHVVSEADEILVTLSDQREFRAQLIGSDERSDLALLKIEASGLPVVKMAAEDDLKVGEWVLAIGSPFGLSYSVAAGIVSYIGRSLPSTENIGQYVSYIQTDVAINPGHSGGPLFNLDGEVIGINSQIFTSTGGSIGLSFAIPVGIAQNVVAQLRDTGAVQRGWMGVGIEDVSQALAEAFRLDTPHGALINQVLPDSPAQSAGFRSGDVIVTFNGHEIRRSGDLTYNVGLTSPGAEVQVDIIRDGTPLSLAMVVGSLDDSNLLSATVPEPAVNRLGLVVAEIDEELREFLGVEDGVVVEQVVGEVGRDAELRAGDVLLTINNEEVDSVEAFEAVVAELPAMRALPVLVIRGAGQPRFFTVRIPE